TGDTGATGATGTTGVTGPNLSSGFETLSTIDQALSIGDFVIFDTNPVFAGTGIAYVAPGDTIFIVQPGLYLVNWAVNLEAGSDASAFGLVINGVSYSGAGNAATGGGNLASSAFIQVTTPPYNVSVNNRSAGARTIVPTNSSSAASITIIRFADGPSV
ncbi:hypothetical protein HF328_19055, partial [Bacillus pumilus sxm20-2]|nr:hypothetical protein [Bacillus pumilus sxm20-2]